MVGWVGVIIWMLCFKVLRRNGVDIGIVIFVYVNDE